MNAGGIAYLNCIIQHPPNSLQSHSLQSLRKATILYESYKCTVNPSPNIPNLLGPRCQDLLQLPLASLPAQLPSDLGAFRMLRLCRTTTGSRFTASFRMVFHCLWNEEDLAGKLTRDLGMWELVSDYALANTGGGS